MIQFKLFGSFFLTLIVLVHSDESCNLDFEKTITTIFAPQEQPTIQIRTLRRYILRLLQSMVAKAEDVEGWNTYVYPKRNLEALARAGYLHTLPEEDNQTEINDKRSLATLVKNGQLPIHNHDEDGSKRSIEFNGEFNRELQKMLDEINVNVPFAEETVSKRNVASIARDGGFSGKRNAAALLKNDRYMQENDGKRNIASIKAMLYPKYRRQENEDFSNQDEYESLVEELLEGQRNQKRFLGSIARTGWYNSPWKYSNFDEERSTKPGKRHIGALARLGWLPTVRSIRGMNRSGRSSSNGVGDISCRETSANGQNQNYYISENSIPLDNKRFLPVPAMWKVPLQTVNY